MSKIAYFGCIFVSFFLLYSEDGVKGVDCYSLEDGIKSNPEFAHQILDGHIVNLKERSKLAMLTIFGEKDVDVNVDGKKRVNNKRSIGKVAKKGLLNSSVRSGSDSIKRVIKKDRCECSGFLISSDGYMITNYSLLKNFSRFFTRIVVKEKKKDVNKMVKLDLVGYDEYLDIALLKGNIKTSNNLLIGGYGDSKVFRYLYCICGEDYKVSGCTEVEFSNVKNRSEGDCAEKINCYSSSYDHLKPCVLVDINGFLVGMRVNCGKFVKNSVCGYKSIVAFKDFKKSISEIRSKKYNSFEYDCFKLVSVDDRLKGIKRLSVNYGCYVDSVNCNSSKLGLKVGDVIVGINGSSVSDIESFEKVYPYLKNDDLVFVVVRGGKRVNVKVVSGVVSDIKYDVVGDNCLSVGGARLVNLDDVKLNLLKNVGVFNVKGVLVSDVSNQRNWGCGKDFVITSVYNKYSVGSVIDVINVFKNIERYVNKVDMGKGVPFVISGFYLNKPDEERTFVSYI